LKKTKVKQVKTDSKVQKEITDTVKSVAESALLMQFPAENTANSNEENESSNTKSETWERKTRQKLDFSHRETISQGQSDTSLTKTWALCTGNNNPPSKYNKLLRLLSPSSSRQLRDSSALGNIFNIFF
jgi:hypothetical protein